MPTITPQAAQTHNHFQFEVEAEGLGRYTIDVSLPLGYETGEQKYPVILMTDGNLLFDVAHTALHGRMSGMGSLLPPSIVVGVGYPADEGWASFYARRNFDFYGEWDMQDPLGQYLQQIFNGMKTAENKPDMEMHAGGGKRFMAFLRDELLPLLAGHYPIDLKARHTLIGDSSGGHFVLRALYDANSPFSRYISISPGFGAAMGDIQKLEAAYAAAHQDMDVDLFICCGQVETDESPATAMCRFGSGVTWVAEQFAIRQWPNARLHWEIMNLEDHGSIPMRAIAAGLRSVHGLRPGVHKDNLAKLMAQYEPGEQ